MFKVGDKSGRLTLKEWDGHRGWTCECICGNSIYVTRSRLESHPPKSCGRSCLWISPGQFKLPKIGTIPHPTDRFKGKGKPSGKPLPRDDKYRRATITMYEDARAGLIDFWKGL